MTSRHRAELSLAGVTFLWGATFVLVKSALTEVSTPLFLTLRFAVAGTALLLVYGRKLRAAGVVPGIVTGSLLFIAYVLQTKGLELTSASKSAFLTGLSIPMVPLASSLVYRSRPRIAEVAGIVVATVGMALMTLPAGRFSMDRGDILSFLCAVAFAVHIVVVGHYSRLSGFETVAVVQILTAAALGLVTFSWIEPFRFRASPSVAAAVLITGLLATAVAFTVMAWAQRYTTATRSALIFSLEPVIAWFTSWLLLGETLPVRGRVGALVILLGILMVEMKRDAVETGVSSDTSL